MSIAAQFVQYFIEPVLSFGFVINITFLDIYEPLAAKFFELRINIFSRFAKQWVRRIAECKHSELQLVELETVLVNMVVEFFGCCGWFAFTLCADHCQ